MSLLHGFAGMEALGQFALNIVRPIITKITGPEPSYFTLTNQQDIEKKLNSQLSSADLFHDRTLAIAIANYGRNAKLQNPQWYLYSGHMHTNMQCNIEPGCLFVGLFVKKKGCATGTVGILSYEIEGTDQKVAILWSVPFDFNIYKVWYNIKSTATDYKMYYDMYYKDSHVCRSGAWEVKPEDGHVKVQATMTDNVHCKLIVWVDADELTLDTRQKKEEEVHLAADLEDDSWSGMMFHMSG